MEIGNKFKVRNKKTNEVFEDTIIGIVPVLIYVDYAHGEDDVYYYNIIGNKFVLTKDECGQIFSAELKEELGCLHKYIDEFELVEE